LIAVNLIDRVSRSFCLLFVCSCLLNPLHGQGSVCSYPLVGFGRRLVIIGDFRWNETAFKTISTLKWCLTSASPINSLALDWAIDGLLRYSVFSSLLIGNILLDLLICNICNLIWLSVNLRNLSILSTAISSATIDFLSLRGNLYRWQRDSFSASSIFIASFILTTSWILSSSSILLLILTRSLIHLIHLATAVIVNQSPILDCWPWKVLNITVICSWSLYGLALAWAVNCLHLWCLVSFWTWNYISPSLTLETHSLLIRARYFAFNTRSGLFYSWSWTDNCSLWAFNVWIWRFNSGLDFIVDNWFSLDCWPSDCIVSRFIV
jgi:hypothetical protein